MKTNQMATCKSLQSPVYTNFTRRFFRFAAPITFVFLAACATVTPAPNLALQAAESSIENADRERVSDYDLPELGQARDKLTAARAAVEDNDMVLARRLADEARVSADLASAKAGKMKATRINDDMIESIETLKQEMHRNNGDMQ